ncbi:hypothetical protein ACRAWD_03160 [Caulobacter segnis]
MTLDLAHLAVRPGPHRLRPVERLAEPQRQRRQRRLSAVRRPGRPQIMDVHVLPTGQVDYMKINNVDIKHIEERSQTTTKTHQIGLTLDHRFNDRLSAEVKVGHTRDRTSSSPGTC